MSKGSDLAGEDPATIALELEVTMSEDRIDLIDKAIVEHAKTIQWLIFESTFPLEFRVKKVAEIASIQDALEKEKNNINDALDALEDHTYL